MIDSFRLLTFFVLLNCLTNCLCLKVSVKENHNIEVDPFKTRLSKRDISQFFDRASYSFNGFKKIESVPIIFPLDICVFEVNEVRHYACLHINKDGARNFVIFRAANETYEELLSLETPLAISMDCKSFAQKGFIALAYNITTSVERANKGSPIFQVDSERVKTVQYFGSPNLRSVYLRTTANDIFLLQTFVNTNTSSNLFCPYFKWSGYGFNKLGRIPCSNARHLEPFSINTEHYVAVANYADKHDRTETNSEIYKYDKEKKKLVPFQSIKTNAAVDVKYFSVPFNEVEKQHFVIFGNSRAINGGEGDHLEADSVIYKFEKGHFIPYQMLPLYSVQKFLPVENVELEKFILLVACSNQDIKIYNLNDWKFEESKVQFTEGALGKGVSNMRIFKHEEDSYLVIANERMLKNETNVFLPIFTQEVHANTLRQQIIDWVTATTNRFSESDVEKLRTDVEAAAKSKKERTSSEVSEIPSAKVEIAYTRSLINPARNFTASYWKTLSYAYQAVEALEARVNKKLAVKRDASGDDKPEYTHETLNVGTLVVRNKLKTKKINGVDPKNIQLKTISAPKVIVNGDFQRPPRARSDITPEFLDTLNVDHLKVSGFLNHLNWSDLQSNTLKKTGQQFLKGPVKIKKLETDTVVTSSDTLNGQNLSKLVLIDGGSYVINQDVQFSKPVYARNLTIKDRLNNIHVLQDKLDVLLVNSDEVQHITGRKSFENIRLLEPVTISGKILGELDIMSPFKPIHRPLNLSGHYTITGDVTVKEILAVGNIVGASGVNSFQKVFSEALPAFGPFDGLKINFEQPIEANHSIVSLVNGQDLKQLVRTDSEEVQVIEGRKTFKGDLQISKGFAEVKILNEIDLDQLEKKILTKTGQQNITGNVRFKKLVAKRVSSPSIRLKDKNLSSYLTKSGNQQSQGSLKIGKLKTDRATFGDLQTERKVFDGLLDSLKSKEVSKINPEIFRNYDGTIHVQNLKIGGFINDISVDNIERLFTLLNGNIKYVGGMKFYHDMKVSNLTFTGKFNGIPADEFGKCWLQQGVDQVFTAPQTFSSVSISKGLKLSGKLDEHDFEAFKTGTYRIDQDEHIANAVFENSIQVETALSAPTVKGLRIPEDILLANSEEPQVLNDAMICLKDVHVKGYLQKLTTVNNVSLPLLNEYLDSDLDTLAVQNAVFENPPIFATLNSHDLGETMDTVWFANADVDLQHHVEIADGYFDGPLDFEGPINGMNMKYLKENYFSLSKPQQVSAEMIFSKPVVFENDLDGENLHVYGSIIDATSNSEFEFNEFAQNSLLKSGKQKITGQWKIYEGLVTGDLNNVRINDLNLAEDVIRLDVGNNQVTAPKYVQSARIENLNCEGRSTVNGVNLLDWVHSAVFVYENYTIQGKTTLDSVIFYNDVQVSGTVNDINFDESTLLLRDREQVIQGNVEIVTKFLEKKRILANSFGELHALSVNGLNIDEFFRCQGVERLQEHINSSLTFANPVHVEHFDGGQEFMDLTEKKSDFNSIHNKTVKALGGLKKIVQSIGHSYENDRYYLSHFEHKQTMHLSAKKVISLTLRVGDSFVDVIGVLEANDESNVVFYRWDFYQQQFVVDNHLSWLPRREASIDIFRAAFGKAEYLAIKTSLDREFYQNVVSTETEGLQEIFKSNVPRLIEALELDGDHCFVVYRQDNGLLSVYCVEFGETGLQFVRKNGFRRSGVSQIVSLEKDYIAALLVDSVEIWKPNESDKPKQKIAAVSPSQIAAVVATDSFKFIAICSKITPKSFHHGSVDIFRAADDSAFQHMQTIDVVNPLQVEFALLPESQDILLTILTESFDEPLTIYQYKGVVGFQPIVSSSTIPPGTAISITHLKASQQHLIAMISADDITLIEMVLSKT